MDISNILYLIFCVLLGVALVLLIKYRKIDKETLSGVASVLEALPNTEGSSVFDLIYKYSKMAVLAVEQLVKSGKIGKTAEERKSAALDMVKSAAEVDGIEYGKEEGMLASACVEAEVHKLPRNNGVALAVSELLNETTVESVIETGIEITEDKPNEAEPAEDAAGDLKAPPDEGGAEE